MIDLITQSGLWALLFTLGTYQLGLFLRRKTGLALCNPTLISALIIIGALLLFRIPNEAYQSGMHSISWLMTPCTVSLAIPLYTQLNRLRRDLKSILLGVFAGTAASLLLVGILCLCLNLDNTLTASMLPKSITTAMAIPLAENGGGLIPLTTTSVILTGVLGSVAGQSLCRLFRIRHPIAQGVAYGTATHVLGTSRATELNELTGAVGSLSLVVAGILTAVVYPMVLPLFT